MNDSDHSDAAENSSPRAALCYGDTIDVFQIGRVQVVQRYACIRRDQFEWTIEGPFPAEFRDYLGTRGTLRGHGPLYILDVPHEFQLTVAANAGRAVFVPRLATELAWQKKIVLEIVSRLDEMLRSV